MRRDREGASDASSGDEARDIPGDENTALRKYVDLGSEIAGGAAGAGVGLVAGGPLGALAGAAGAPLIIRTLSAIAGEFLRRRQGPREAERTGAVFLLAIEAIRSELSSGRSELRDDEFFKEGSAGVGRSSAAEILEAVILAAQRDPEERKLPYYAYLLKNIAFNKAIGIYEGQNMTRLLRDLTYRQLCMLVLFSMENDLGLKTTDHDKITRSHWLRSSGLLFEMSDLYRRGFVNCDWRNGVFPEKVQALSLGYFLVSHAELRRMNTDELHQLQSRLLMIGDEQTPFV